MDKKLYDMPVKYDLVEADSPVIKQLGEKGLLITDKSVAYTAKAV